MLNRTKILIRFIQLLFCLCSIRNVNPRNFFLGAQYIKDLFIYLFLINAYLDKPYNNTC